MAVFIKALNVEDCGNGLFRVELSERELTKNERDVLKELFPNLTEQVYELLSQEQLIESLASSREVDGYLTDATPPKPVKKMRVNIDMPQAAKY